MGTFDFGGISAELEKFDGLARGTEEACGRAVEAGGKALARKLKDAAPVYAGTRRDIKPGALKRSVKAGKVKYSAADGYHCDVGPVGTDHGESLAKIGNILEYGRSNMEPRPWFAGTVADAADEVTQVMQRTFEEAQGNG